MRNKKKLTPAPSGEHYSFVRRVFARWRPLAQLDLPISELSF